MIEASFHKKIGEFDLNASISGEGMILLTGANGSGKTTFLKSIAGYFPIDSGTIILNSVNVTEMPVSARKAVYIGSDSSINSLTVHDHIAWPKSSLTLPEKERIMISLGIDFNGKVGNLSLGQRIRVSIATAIISGPRILLIDEVLANVSKVHEFCLALSEIALRSRIDVIAAMQTDDLKDVFGQVFCISNGLLSRVK
ncbi:MAG: ATP-binding cassette domain-containing protein [Candidatus Thermoplasmatota archaeon]|nr:ATP-binding cassette domain-containing protein [Candidatus Thermoplasmatota archaeon]